MLIVFQARSGSMCRMRVSTMKRLSSPETPRKGRAGISTTCAPMEANATLTAPFDGLDRAPAESRQENIAQAICRDLVGSGGRWFVGTRQVRA